MWICLAALGMIWACGIGIMWRYADLIATEEAEDRRDRG